MNYEQHTQIISRENKSNRKLKHIYVGNIVLEGIMLKTIHNFTYPESKTTSDRKCRKDVVSKIAQGKQVFYKKINCFFTNTMSLDTNKVFIKSFMRIVVLYGIETWTITEAEKVEIKGFEILYLRKCYKLYG